MPFTLTIDTANAAFDNDAVPELARILHHLANHLPTFAPVAAAGIPVLDYNGNTVGRWSYEPEARHLTADEVAAIIAAYDAEVRRNMDGDTEILSNVATDQHGEVFFEVVQVGREMEILSGDPDDLSVDSCLALQRAVEAYRASLAAELAR